MEGQGTKQRRHTLQKIALSKSQTSSFFHFIRLGRLDWGVKFIHLTSFYLAPSYVPGIQQMFKKSSSHLPPHMLGSSLPPGLLLPCLLLGCLALTHILNFLWQGAQKLLQHQLLHHLCSLVCISGCSHRQQSSQDLLHSLVRSCHRQGLQLFQKS